MIRYSLDDGVFAPLRFIVDYYAADECENKEAAFYTCRKCGRCGRVFEDGVMVDSGGTHVNSRATEEVFYNENKGVSE